jgi:aspartyl/asparaginyl-tRNA synthetase
MVIEVRVPCFMGYDLASEHERFLVEEHFKKPVIMTRLSEGNQGLLYENQ